jgi:nitrate reductase beta subunit
LVTVTVLPVAALMVQVKVALPLAPVVSVAVTVTLGLPAVVGVPEISPVDELIDRPAGSPLAV